MLSRRRLVALLAALPFTSRALAQPIADSALPPLPSPTLLPLYPGAAPGSESWTQQEIEEPEGWNRIIRNVTHPALVAYRPAKPNGAAIILVPGGAFYFLSLGNEGYDTAQKLLAEGFTVFLLKYRLIATEKGWHSEVDRRLSQPGWEKSLSDQIGAFTLADAQAALRLARSKASEFAFSPQRLGMLGFSAGGYVVTRATLESAPSLRPDFTGCIYGVKPPELLPAASTLPPLFLAWAGDDDLVPFARNAQPLCDLWHRSGAELETHVFAHGGHGFGSLSSGRPVDRWLELFVSWARALDVKR